MTGGATAGIPVTLPDGTLLGRANVDPGNGWLRLSEVVPLPEGFQITNPAAARVAESELARLRTRETELWDRVAEMEARLSGVTRERDRWAAKFGRLQAAALQLKVEASDSEEELGADAWDPETHDFRQEEPGG